MTAVHAENAVGEGRPSHYYELAHFGLTGAEADERFADYLNARW